MLVKKVIAPFACMYSPVREVRDEVESAAILCVCGKF